MMTNEPMPLQQARLEYDDMEAGFEFPPASIRLEPERIALYLGAVGETSRLYQEMSLVPPSAIAACAQSALAERISLLPGTIHVSQGLEFLGTAQVDETLISRARVSRKQERGKIRILNIDLDVFDQNSRLVMRGKSSFILPQPE